jgi:hypothetical protein
MMLKRSTTESKPSAVARFVRAGVASLVVAGAVAALATGCLDRNLCTTKDAALKKQGGSDCEPKTSNLFVDQIVQTAVDKIDLLFMVDNSVSMADKQEILKDAVPVLVARLISPICVDGTGKPTGESSMGGVCAKGGSPEFNPIGDIHIGIVSSSLGAHGGTVCSTGAVTDTLDDKGELIGARRPAPGGMPNPTAALNFDPARTWKGLGFLAWDPSGTRNGATPGIKDPVALQTAFQDMIVADGEHGCGYEASLEAWYRFLIDPEPPASVGLDAATKSVTVRSSALTIDPSTKKPKLDPMTGNAVCVGCDETLRAQRKAFLRPDSLVAIVMMSDENDCSIRDDGVGWFVGSSARMPRSTSQCDANPNDPCCRSCAQRETNGPPSGCPALTADSVCKNIPTGQQYVTWDQPNDSLNLRCYNQHKRFGFDLLYETARYVNGLTQTTLPLQSNGTISVTNPLYDTTGSSSAPRDPSLVFLAGIVGVPWQDIADDASLTGAGLNYLTAKELVAKDRWSALLGTPQGATKNGVPVPPSDPFMVESITPRSGMNTIANVSITAANSPKPNNAINGHEQNVPMNDDLQYACTFPLKTARTCMAADTACDCSPDKAMSSAAVTAANSPLCQGGANINTQTSAKAYPGARELQVLKDLGDNAIVASICPKVVTSNAPGSDPNYGYNPAVGAIIERLKEALKGKCLPRPIQTNDQGQVLCKVIEAQKMGCDCTTPGNGRAPATDPQLMTAVQTQLKATGNCGNTGQDPCTTWCQCEILQESGGDLKTCQTNQPVNTPGYCYIDKTAENAAGANVAAIEAALAKCPSNQQQLLHFQDSPTEKTPAQGAVAFIACLGAPIGATATPVGTGGGN